MPDEAAHFAARQAAALKDAVEIGNGLAAQDSLGEYPAKGGFVDEAHCALSHDGLLCELLLCAVPDLHDAAPFRKNWNSIISYLREKR